MKLYYQHKLFFNIATNLSENLSIDKELFSGERSSKENRSLIKVKK